MNLTDTVIRNRFWIICFIIIMFSFLNPSQFQKGGISDVLLKSIPLSALILSYFYVFFLKDITVVEKTIIPFVLLPLVYITITIFSEITLNAIFDDYNIGVNKTKSTTFLVNLFYYSLITFPILALTNMYAKMFPYK